MVAYNFDMDEFLEQLSKSDYVEEQIDDRSTTFQYLLESAIDTLANKKKTLQKLESKKMAIESALASEKLHGRSLQDKLLERNESFTKENEAIKSLEKRLDDFIKKYTQGAHELHHKLSSVSDEFNSNTLKQTIRELEQHGKKEIDGDIAESVKQIRILDEDINKLKMELPDFQALKKIRDEVFDENDLLEKRKWELDNVSTFINNLKAKLSEVHK